MNLSVGGMNPAAIDYRAKVTGSFGRLVWMSTFDAENQVQMTVVQMQEAASLGAFIEFVGGSLTTADATERMDRFAAAIKQVGARLCILSSDLGQVGNALPTDGFAAFIAAMRARGISDADLDLMTRQNPARALGLR